MKTLPHLSMKSRVPDACCLALCSPFTCLWRTHQRLIFECVHDLVAAADSLPHLAGRGGAFLPDSACASWFCFPTCGRLFPTLCVVFLPQPRDIGCVARHGGRQSNVDPTHRLPFLPQAIDSNSIINAILNKAREIWPSFLISVSGRSARMHHSCCCGVSSPAYSFSLLLNPEGFYWWAVSVNRDTRCRQELKAFFTLQAVAYLGLHRSTLSTPSHERHLGGNERAEKDIGVQGEARDVNHCAPRG